MLLSREWWLEVLKDAEPYPKENKTMEPDLLPCPYCLTQMNNEVALQWLPYGQTETYHYGCPHCGAHSPASPKLITAREQWNTLVIAAQEARSG